ncbi:Uncharacterised protein [Mycobacteroides abscessus subsp. abscessus]|nr:Uncharacterised protein [Mycobacteroides abscessus subsp. abscessus]
MPAPDSSRPDIKPLSALAACSSITVAATPATSSTVPSTATSVRFPASMR